MGCDIHVFIEKRLKPTEPWRADENHVRNTEFGNPYLEQVRAVGRDYRLFGLLAGVRTYENPLFPRRGIPKDCSFDIAKEGEDIDYHSHSWLTIEEFRACMEATNGYDLENTTSDDAFHLLDCSNSFESYIAIVNYCNNWIANEAAEAALLNRTDIIPEIRLIFWFDS